MQISDFGNFISYFAVNQLQGAKRQRSDESFKDEYQLGSGKG